MQKNIDNFGLLRSLIKKKRSHVHLVGICGVGMAGVAFHLKKLGFNVTGCDTGSNARAAWLKKCGVNVISKHDSAHLAGVDWVVRSAAIRESHLEIAHAHALNIPVFRRGVVLAALCSTQLSVVVCGTHGKTTTASMIVQLLKGAGLSPSFCIGGESPALGGVAGCGKSTIMILEADESDGTLIYYQPDLVVLTGFEFDHAEYFRNLEQLHDSFAQLLKQVKQKVIYCRDNDNAEKLCHNLDKTFSYGFSPSADLRAIDVKEAGDSVSFSLVLRGKKLRNVNLPVPGRHNILNALASYATAIELKCHSAKIEKALSLFEPVDRRFERVVQQDNVLVVSDYAHHPAEVGALLQSVRHMNPRRLLAVFQPHRYTRTRAFAKQFPLAFNDVEQVILLPVYSASEEPVSGGTVWDLYKHFRALGKTRTLCASSLHNAWSYLRSVLQEGDLLLIIGAGDVDNIARWAQADFEHYSLRNLHPASEWLNKLQTLNLHATSICANEPLAPKTTLHVGGVADILLNVSCEEDIIRILPWADKHKIPVTVLGAGSNVLVSDLGVRGIVLCLVGSAFTSVCKPFHNSVVAGAGVLLNDLMKFLAQHGKTGLEFLTGIPGTVGGALRMNAGALGKAIGERVSWVNAIDKNGHKLLLKKQDLRFAYRACETLRNTVILEAAFEVENCDSRDILRSQAAILKQRRWMSQLHCAGSVFKNPKGNSAGRLAEEAGLKKYSVGNAHVSARHANMIVTEDGASSSDVVALIEIMRSAIKTCSGIELENEIVFLE